MQSPGGYNIVSTVIAVGFGLFLGALISTRLLDSITLFANSNLATRATTRNPQKPAHRKIEIPFNCTTFDLTKKCPTTQEHSSDDLPSSGTCPEYFRWIYEDLRPWAYTGITKETMETVPKEHACFKLVIVDGRVYVQKLLYSFQTRDVFTQYGIVQLLRRYPGKLPDLELKLDCGDGPVIKSSGYGRPGDPPPPPLFSYCGDDETLNIVFPDWSFWGWPEINIKPWEQLLEDLEGGNNRSKWMDREPYAFWKGTPLSPNRQDLMRCNPSPQQDWGARLYAQNWKKETRQGFRQSDLASQCTNRFKIYIEGRGWSVSEKYILACDSVTLLVKPHFYDFFTRGLMPMQHYWPIKKDDKCKSIKHAVDWGNNNTQKAQDIAKEGSKFIQEKLKMDHAYDYMFHLLNEYAKLFRYKPEVPENAVEICSENMVCLSKGLQRAYMIDSMVKSTSDTGPCTMPPPYDPGYLQAFLKTKEDSIARVDQWEKQYWESKSNSSNNKPNLRV